MRFTLAGLSIYGHHWHNPKWPECTKHGVGHRVMFSKKFLMYKRVVVLFVIFYLQSCDGLFTTCCHAAIVISVFFTYVSSDRCLKEECFFDSRIHALVRQQPDNFGTGQSQSFLSILNIFSCTVHLLFALFLFQVVLFGF